MISASPSTERRGLRRRLLTVMALLKVRLSYWAWQGIRDAARIGARTQHTEHTEYWFAVFTMLVGVWVCLPNATFSPVFALLARFLPKWVWGLILVAAGRYALHALVTGSKSVRCGAMYYLLGCGLFLFVASVLEAPTNTATVIYAIYCYRVARTSRQLCSKGCC